MFEFTISKQCLLMPLLMVSGAVDKKQSLAILSHILLQLTTKEMLLTATDLEIQITARIDIKTSSATGKMTVPAKKIIDIVRSLDENATPMLSFREPVLSIKEGRGQFKLATLPSADYPNIEDEKSELAFSILRTPFMQLLQSTHFSMSQQDVRVFLNGLLLEIDSQFITAVATDGHRMAICKLPCPLTTEHHRLLLPRKGVLEIIKLLSTIVDEQVDLSFGRSHFKVVTRQYTFISKLVDARFPPYIKAIPTNQDKHIVVDRDILKKALSRIIILANEKSRAILLHLEPMQFTLIAHNQEQEEAIDTVVAETEGEALKIGMNANYLLDVLNHIGMGKLRMSFTDANSSVLIKSLENEDYSFVIMPMKL